MSTILKKLASGRILVSDGAWGTRLFDAGLNPGECPEAWNINNPDKVKLIAEQYVEAGSDIICTNSFGGTRIKLSQYGLENESYRINKTAALLSREAAGNKLVFGSVGPTGKFLITGEITEDELFDAYKDQTIALADGGVDAILLETFYDINEAIIAINAVKNSTKLAIACSFTYDKQPDGSYKTITGFTPAQITEALVKSGINIIGSNCGQGFENITGIAKEIRETNNSILLLIQANAGIPKTVDGKIVYTETPESIKPHIESLITSGVNIIGGCCGTTPDHIKMIRKITDGYNRTIR